VTIFIHRHVYILLLASCLLCVAGFSWAYDGYLFDAMAQIDGTVDMDKAMHRVQNAGVDKIALFARSRAFLGENENTLIQLRDRYPNLIILGSPKYFLMRDDLDNVYIEATINGIVKKRYRFVGEILYTHGDKSRGEQTSQGERYINPLNNRTTIFLTKLAATDVPVMTHWEVYAWQHDWPRFSRVYSSHPKINFIIPHMAFGSPKQVDMIFSRNPNVYMTISKKLNAKDGFSDVTKQSKLGSSILDDKGILRDEWSSILIKYQDRILFATDAHKAHRWKEYGKEVKRYLKLANQLPVEVARKISYLNAEKLYGVKVK